MKPRREARHVALEVLYELDCTTHPVDEVFARRVADNPMEPEHIAFARQLVDGVRARSAALDVLIARSAPEFPLENLPILDLNILRIALWEFGVAHITPPRIAMFEAVEMAKIYAGDASTRFVNGVLGALFEDQEKLVKELAVE